jgi:protein-tyrosine phosphatase
VRTVLFICTGNTCRSPMAEAIAQDWMDRELPDDDRCLAVSAGAMTGGGQPVSAEAVQAMADLGLTLEGRSKPVTGEMIRAAEAVFGMGSEHVAAARLLVRGEEDQLEKIQRLDPEGNVADPIGLGQEAYDELAARFRELIPMRLREVLFHEDRAGV